MAPAKRKVPLDRGEEPAGSRKKDGSSRRRRKDAQRAAFIRYIHTPRALWQTFQGQNVPEKKKIPISKVSWSDMPVVLLHLVAISLAIVISALNLKGLWLGKELTGPSGHDAEKLLALQFAAKLHKLMMLVSLSHILFFGLYQTALVWRWIAFGSCHGRISIQPDLVSLVKRIHNDMYDNVLRQAYHSPSHHHRYLPWRQHWPVFCYGT